MDRLAMDSTAAIKAGMSYGKWKALHPHTEIEVPVRKKSGTRRRCKVCGEEIPLHSKGHLYCGDICAYEAQKARMREFYQRKKERMMANGQV